MRQIDQFETTMKERRNEMCLHRFGITMYNQENPYFYFHKKSKTNFDLMFRVSNGHIQIFSIIKTILEPNFNMNMDSYFNNYINYKPLCLTKSDQKELKTMINDVDRSLKIIFDGQGLINKKTIIELLN